MPNIAVFTAGANHNLHALLEAFQTGNLKDGEIVLVVSSAEAALKHARKAGVETLAVPADSPYGEELAQAIAPHNLDLIVTLDAPHHFDTAFLKKYAHKVLAVQPSLDGHFPGANAVEQAFEAFQAQQIKWSGCNIHYVGPGGTVAGVMRQLVVPIEPKEALERFAARMRKGEHWLLLKAVKQVLYELRTRNKRTVGSSDRQS
ncbi:MAG: hypothetical protein K8J31_04300 [Anaerolineae bacterium]|nr:hypothetical protein [Anaerolineae bacterium]